MTVSDMTGTVFIVDSGHVLNDIHGVYVYICVCVCVYPKTGEEVKWPRNRRLYQESIYGTVRLDLSVFVGKKPSFVNEMDGKKK
jgi:hypothetical protein